MAGKVPERKPKGAGQYRGKQGKKTVGVYERPNKKSKQRLTLLLAIVVILAMVLGLLFAGRF